MEYYKIIILTITTFILLYVLNDLYLKYVSTRESFIMKTPSGEYKDIKYNTNHGITNFNGDIMMPINQYIVKSSYNSAISGKFVSIDMLRFVLSRGCRFLDFEVVFIEDKPYVALTTDPQYTLLDTDNKILLTDILTAVNSFAFTNPSPCPSDPIFIQLRVKSINKRVYTEIAKSIDVALNYRLYKQELNPNTTFNDVMGKAVIIFDNDIHPQYKELSACENPNSETCYDLTKYVNLTSNSKISTKRKYLEFLESKKGKILTVMEDNSVDVDKITIAVPEYFSSEIEDNVFTSSDVAHPNIYTYTDNYNVQMLCYRYYMRDEQLDICEQFFAQHKSAFIPYYIALAFIKRIQQ